MIDIKTIKVGDKAWYIDRRGEIVESVIEKVGRKYVTCKAPYRDQKFEALPHEQNCLVEHTDYGAHVRLYLDRNLLAEKLERNRLEKDILYDLKHVWKYVTMEELRQIDQIYETALEKKE